MDIKKLLDNFEWSDESAQDSGETAQPESLFAEKILACAESIADYIMNNISIDSCEDNKVITISVPDSIHPLLQERKNTKWTVDSRETVFEVIRGAFISVTDDESYRTQIEEKVNNLFSPPIPVFNLSQQEMEELLKRGSNLSFSNSHSPFRVEWMRLYDDPPMLISTHTMSPFEGVVAKKEEITGGEIVVEIGINSD